MILEIQILKYITEIHNKKTREHPIKNCNVNNCNYKFSVH